MIEKKPIQALILFAVPIIIGNFFQQIYTMVDSAIVGRYVSKTALAAIGASTSLTNIFICIAIGGGMGASVIVSGWLANWIISYAEYRTGKWKNIMET